MFHRATYKDVGMALNLNRLIVFAPLCTVVWIVDVSLGGMCDNRVCCRCTVGEPW
jgi:hypothetical protein